MRWDHPQLGTVPPDEFISLAEEEGLIVPLQRWVLRRATRDAAAMLAAGWDVMTASTSPSATSRPAAWLPTSPRRWPSPACRRRS